MENPRDVPARRERGVLRRQQRQQDEPIADMREEEEQDPAAEPKRRRSAPIHHAFEYDPACQEQCEFCAGEWVAGTYRRQQYQCGRIPPPHQSQDCPEEQCMVIGFETVDDAAAEICAPAARIERKQPCSGAQFEQDAAQDSEASSPQEERQDEALCAAAQPYDAYV